MGRNTALLTDAIYTLSTELDDPEYALDQLESHLYDALLVNVGDANTVGEYAKQLRLNITQEECFTVLDYLAEQKMVAISIAHVETAINELFEDRFIEP